MKDSAMYFSFYEEKEHKICEVIADDVGGEVIDATYMARLSVSSSSRCVERKALATGDGIWKFGLALPMHDNMYYIITDCWMERFHDKNTNKTSFILPRIDSCEY